MKKILTTLSVLVLGATTGNLNSLLNTSISKNNLKICNGEIVNNFDEYPYNAGVLNLEENTPFPKESLYSKFTGSATFIDQNFLLTAGHVITNNSNSICNTSDIKIAYGGLNLKHEIDFTIFNVKKIYRYTDFYSFKDITVNDLAIIEIEPHPEILLKTVILPNEDNLQKLTENNKIVRNIGWGIYNSSNTTSEKLRYYDAFIQNENQVNNYLHTKKEKYWDCYKNNSMIATKSNNSKSSMGHDSGGPMLSFDNINNQYVQIGITSWGLNYALDNKNDGFNFYTRLNINFLNWIKSIIG